MPQNLTGGSLLIRNKYYIVIYRGKDFVPTNVAEVLAERQELVNQVQEVEENLRCGSVDAIPSEENEATALAGSLAEFYEAQARWGRDISAEEREKMMEEAAEAKSIKLIKKVEHKLAVVSFYLFYGDNASWSAFRNIGTATCIGIGVGLTLEFLLDENTNQINFVYAQRILLFMFH